MKRTDTSSIRAGKEKILQAEKLTNPEARLLVANYYMAQELRKRSDMQKRHIGDKTDPNLLISYFADCMADIEEDIKKGLLRYAEASPVGRWLVAQYGIGPVISAGLLAHIDIEQAPVVSHIWRFAGLDPSSKWYGRAEADKIVSDTLKEQGIKKANEDTVAQVCQKTGKRYDRILRFTTTDKDGSQTNLTAARLAAAIAMRPYNPAMKQICWHAGQCFKRLSGEKGAASLYSSFYRQEKANLVAKNDAGGNAERAKIYYTKSADVKKKLAEGKLPDGNLDSQACNNTVQIFLSHLHAVMYWDHFNNPPPRPFAMAVLGHAHEIKIPNLEMFPGLEEAYYHGTPIARRA